MVRQENLKRIAILLALSAGFMVTAGYLWPRAVNWNQRQLANQLAAEVQTAQDTEVQVSLRQLARLGNVAIDHLVEASVSDRSVVASLAQKIIREQFDSWQVQAELNPEFDLVTPSTTLANALADRIKRYGPQGRKWAEDIAVRLIVIAERVPANLAPKMLEDCTHILAVIPARGPKLRNVGEDELHSLQVPSRTLDAPPVALNTFAVPSESVLSAPRTSTIQLQQSKARLSASTSAPAKSTLTAQPAEQNWSPEWGKDRPSEPIDAKPIATAPQQPTESPVKVKPVGEKPARLRFVDVPSPAELAQQMKRLRKRTSQELVRLLANRSDVEGGPIRVVLRERGLTDAEMKLTDRFSSAQETDRLQLIEDLAVLPASTARRWLHWLLEDQSPEVRLKALSAIATTSDPTLYEVARDMAVNDQDNRVAELASKILKTAR